MRRYLIFLFLLSREFSGIAQSDTSKLELKEIIVTGFQVNDPKNTSLNIEPHNLVQINEKSPYNLSDALAKIPGISQMTTGNSISKPVIRGLYGNRILVLLSGLRFDNQQWQDEHGLGLSQIGIDRVEVIKGPASLLYGSDALGGVINVVEEKPNKNGTKLDFGTQLYSNTLGTLTNAGISKKKAANWWRIRIGYESHSDYSDGSNTRVLNSRNTGQYLKAGFGFDKPKWKQENSYNFSYNNYGFILEELNSFFEADARRTRKMNGPHHIVMLNLLNTQNSFLLKKSTLKLNGGIQSNSRREDEGGGQISLNMHLLSLLQNIRWEKEIAKKLTMVWNQQFSFVNNTNYGGRIIIPDANMLENNVSAYVKYKRTKLILEAGAGANNKFIKTKETRSLNTPGTGMLPFSKNNTTANGMFGFSFNPNSKLTIKGNGASGFRAPNLAELSSNGLHEGVYRYEIGNPDLKVENNINTDISTEYRSKQAFINIAGFVNQFYNYVYLAPTSEKFFGYPVFRYKQQNALLYGGELFVIIKPKALKWFQFREAFTITHGQLADKSYLPFIPAYKSITGLRFERKYTGKLSSVFMEPEFVYVFEQNHPAQFETSTPAYYLLNFSSGLVINEPKGNWVFGLNATNILNRKYADHLSRLKYYGLYNQGINFVFSIRKEFKW